jgi:hypothetical protein
MSHLLKLARAKEHFEALDSDIRRYVFDEETVAIRFVVSKDRKQHSAWARLNHEPPAEWGPLIGDTVHNLRCTLDHIVWQLADPAERGTHTMFPIFTVADQFAETDKKGRATWRSGLNKLRGVPPDAGALIEASQPYHWDGTGDHPGKALELLNDLENIDKHRTLHFAVGDTRVQTLELPNIGTDGAEATVFPEATVEKGAETEIFRVALPTAEAGMDMKINFTFEVVFGQTGVVDREPVDRLLAALVGTVERLTSDLEPHLP